MIEHAARPATATGAKDASADRNLALLQALVRDQVARPARAPRIPAGALVIPMPDDDPAVANHNFDMAARWKRGGRQIVLLDFKRGRPVARPGARLPVLSEKETELVGAFLIGALAGLAIAMLGRALEEIVRRLHE